MGYVFHPNPMRRQGPGDWIDTHQHGVMVKPFRVNNSKNPQRYTAGVANRRGVYEVVSRHITEEQAVVAAQTIANRLYLNKLRGKKRTRSTNKSLIAEHQYLVNQIEKALKLHQQGKTEEAKLTAYPILADLALMFHWGEDNGKEQSS